MAAQDATQQVPYRVVQLEWDAEKGYHNAAVENFDGLVTHHPNSNSGAHLVNGTVVGGQLDARWRWLAVRSKKSRSPKSGTTMAFAQARYC